MSIGGGEGDLVVFWDRGCATLRQSRNLRGSKNLESPGNKPICRGKEDKSNGGRVGKIGRVLAEEKRIW